MKKRNQRTCANGHVFYKSSSCPICPYCENKNRPTDGFMAKLAAPARRALVNAGIDSLDKLSQYSLKELESLHGIGPNALLVLEKELLEHNLSFRS